MPPPLSPGLTGVSKEGICRRNPDQPLEHSSPGDSAMPYGVTQVLVRLRIFIPRETGPR